MNYIKKIFRLVENSSSQKADPRELIEFLIILAGGKFDDKIAAYFLFYEV